MGLMNPLARRHALLVLFLSLVACGGLVSGGAGARDTQSSTGVPLTAMYGLDRDEQLTYLVLVKFPPGEVATTSSSNWKGSATHSSGVSVRYSAGTSEIKIGLGILDLANGHVFVVTPSPGNTRISQLAVPLGTGPYAEEVDRIAGGLEVEAALKVP